MVRKAIIKCEKGKYRICDEVGVVPDNCDCVIKGFYIKNNKIITRGTITFIIGNGTFHLIGNVIENE